MGLRDQVPRDEGPPFSGEAFRFYRPQLGENVWDEQDFEDEEEEAGEDQDEEDQDEETEDDEGEDDEEQEYRDGQDFAKMLLDHLALPGHTEAENDDDDHG